MLQVYLTRNGFYFTYSIAYLLALFIVVTLVYQFKKLKYLHIFLLKLSTNHSLKRIYEFDDIILF